MVLDMKYMCQHLCKSYIWLSMGYTIHLSGNILVHMLEHIFLQDHKILLYQQLI